MKASEILDQVSLIYFDDAHFQVADLDQESLDELKSLEVFPEYVELNDEEIGNRGFWGVRFLFTDLSGSKGMLFTNRKIKKSDDGYLAIQAGQYI